MELEEIKPSRQRKSPKQQLFEKDFIHNQEYRPKTEEPKNSYKRKPKNQREWQSLIGEEDDE
jgi:hypothetical protein